MLANFSNLITFSRGSNATVTDASGRLTYAPHNLLPSSQDFEAASWTKSNVNIYANLDLGNGTMGPELVTLLDGWTASNATVSVVGGQLVITSAGSGSVYITKNFTNIGGAYYYSTSTVSGGSVTVNTYRTGPFTNYMFTIPTDGTSLTQPSTDTDTTAAVTLYWTASAAGETRTLSNISIKEITPVAAIAPDGTHTADTLMENSANGDHSVARLAALTQTSLLSVYAKAGTRNILALGESSNGTYAKFDLSSGVVTSTGTGQISGGAITPAGNGWYRCSCIYTHGGVNRSLGISMCDASGNVSYAGNGTGTLSLWGAQLEAITYQTTPSPYVSTSVANLLGFSEDFTNAAWSKVGAAIVPSAAQNPINNLWNAQKLMETTATSGHYISVSTVPVVSGATYTQSIYAKAGERSWIRLVFGTGFSTSNTWFNLANGTVGTVGAASASIQSVGNGWYRISVTQAATSTTNGQIFIAVETSGVSTSYTGDGNSGIYIYGAQLSNSGSLDPYVPTPGAAPSSTAYYGPRFDYDPVTLAAKGILIEEQRTNLLTYSEQFDNGAWSKTRISVTPNAQVAPDGTLTADVVTANVGASDSISQGPTLTAAIHTVSIYLRGTSSSTQVTIGLFSGGFLPATGQILSGPGSISGSGLISVTGLSTTQWTRISFTTTSATPAGSVPLLIYPGGGGTANASIAMWGAQLEAGAFATSYIPTVASQVTRTADVASITGSLFSQWYRQDEGTFVVQMNVQGQYPHGTSVRLDASNNMEFYAQSAGTARTGNFDVTTGGSVQASLVTASTAVSPFRMASTYALNDFRTVIAGGTVVADTAGTVPAASLVYLGSRNGSQFFANGHIQNITYYPTRLTNDQLQAITK